MFENKNSEYKISYESFPNIFETQFIIGFGYPRKDTCSICDSLKAEIATLTEKTEKRYLYVSTIRTLWNRKRIW